MSVTLKTEINKIYPCNSVVLLLVDYPNDNFFLGLVPLKLFFNN